MSQNPEKTTPENTPSCTCDCTSDQKSAGNDSRPAGCECGDRAVAGSDVQEQPVAVAGSCGCGCG